MGSATVRMVNASMMYLYAGIAGVQAWSGDGGPATAATLRQPAQCASATNGDLYVADMVRIICPGCCMFTRLMPSYLNCREIVLFVSFMQATVLSLRLLVSRANFSPAVIHAYHMSE